MPLPSSISFQSELPRSGSQNLLPCLPVVLPASLLSLLISCRSRYPHLRQRKTPWPSVIISAWHSGQRRSVGKVFGLVIRPRWIYASSVASTFGKLIVPSRNLAAARNRTSYQVGRRPKPTAPLPESPGTAACIIQPPLRRPSSNQTNDRAPRNRDGFFRQGSRQGSSAPVLPSLPCHSIV